LIHLGYSDIHRADAQWTQAFIVVIKSDQTLKSTEAKELLWVDSSNIDSWLSACPDGICRYCKPSDVWKMYQNETIIKYESFLSMTLENFNYAAKIHLELMNGGKNPVISTSDPESSNLNSNSSSV
jgi:hypothetical protein